MNNARIYHTLTMLADGKVLAVGGEHDLGPVHDHQRRAARGDLGSGDAAVDRRSAPSRRRATTTRPRCCMPDGTRAGGRRRALRTTLNDPGEFNAQVYSPAYLFDGPRPTISSAPASAHVRLGDHGLHARTRRTIGSVNLVSFGADTHQSDMDQHFVPLSFTAGSGSLTVTGPGERRDRTARRLHAVHPEQAGVPSIAATVHLDRRTADGPVRAERASRRRRATARRRCRGRLRPTAARRSRRTRSRRTSDGRPAADDGHRQPARADARRCRA